MEHLNEIVLDKATGRHHLRVYVSGGGAEQRFDSGETTEETVYKLRVLADLLERSIAARKKG